MKHALIVRFAETKLPQRGVIMKIFIRRYGRRKHSSLHRIVPGAIAVFLTAVALRALLASDFGLMIERTLVAAGQNPAFARAAVGFELTGILPIEVGSSELASGLLSSESSVLWAYRDILRESPGIASANVSVVREDAEDRAIDTKDLDASAPPSESTPAQDGQNGAGSSIVPITISPASPSGYDYADGVYIKNQTSMTIDVNKALTNQPDLSLSSDGPQVLIIHTHTSEAYTPDEQDYYVPTDVERTQDPAFNVVRVGNAITEIFEKRGISVIHNATVHDYPSYSGSYTRTLEEIEKILAQYPSISVVIDVHRDALIADDETVYKTVTTIGDTPTAQVMLVMGTGEDGLSHPDWKDNLRLAVRIQKNMAEKYPTLARPLNLRTERFNQHATKGSMLVEIGASGNTMSEALAGARLFAECAADILVQYQQ